MEMAAAAGSSALRGYGDATVAAREMTPLELAEHALAEVVGELSGLLDSLGAQLAPLRRSVPEEGNVPADPIQKDPTSHVVEYLMIQTSRLHDLTKQVRTIQYSLDT